MIDAYTKAVLTAIAIGLMFLVGQNFAPAKQAYAAFGNCGEQGNPCRMVLCEQSRKVTGQLQLNCP